MLTRLVVGLTAVVLIGGCGVSTQRQAKVWPDAEVPFSLLEADSGPPVSATPAAVVVQLCLHDGRRLQPVDGVVGPPARLLDVARALGRAEQAAPGAELRSAIPEPGFVRDVVLASGVASVDLSGPFGSLDATEQLLAIAQLVCTLTSRPGVGQVAFTLDGVPVDLPRPDGSIAPGPAAREHYAPLLP